MITEPSLAVDLGAGLVLHNPVLPASGCFHYGQEFAPYFELSQLGGIVVKSLSARPRGGHRPPRGAETLGGMLNAIGLQNPGVEAFCERELPWLVSQRVPIIVSVFGNTIDEYARVAERLRGAPGVAALEVNISCPNIEDRSRMFAAREESAAAVVRAVRRVATQPIFTKLSADTTDIVAVARAALDAGTHGLAVMNTILGMAIDTETMAPKLSTVTGGLSGPAIKPIAVRCVYQVAQAFPDVPIIGQGGIRTGQDVAEFMLAGAWAVAVGTANFVNPRATLEVIEQFREYLRRKGIAQACDLRGMLRAPR